LTAAAIISSVAPALLSASTIAGSGVGIVIGYPHVAPGGARDRRQAQAALIGPRTAPRTTILQAGHRSVAGGSGSPKAARLAHVAA
jgi:hypothetical protein